MHHGMQGPYFPKRGAAAEEWVEDLDRQLSVYLAHMRPQSVLSTTENKQKPTQIIWPSMVVHTLISAFRRLRQADSYKFKTSRVYTVSTGPARTTEWDPVF